MWMSFYLFCKIGKDLIEPFDWVDCICDQVGSGYGDNMKPIFVVGGSFGAMVALRIE